MSATLAAAVPERCHLEHKVFTTLGDVAFRRSEGDGIPMMSVHLGERQASIPLNSLQRELAIVPDSPDGRMLELITGSLDYVTCLQPGDKLPLEIRTGEASWQPSATHCQIAAARLRLQLVTWYSPEGRWSEIALDDGAALLDLTADPLLHGEVALAAWHAAKELGSRLPAQIISMIDDLAQEMSYIEALRERLLLRVEHAGHSCADLAQRCRSKAGLAETSMQVVRLISVGYRQIRSRFEDVDAQTGEIISMLRNIESQRCFIRSNRDWLYRSQRAWDATLQGWQTPQRVIGDGTAALLAQTYQFLAPRFMPTTQWQVAHQPKRRRVDPAARMTW